MKTVLRLVVPLSLANPIRPRLAGAVLLVVLGCLIVFHLAILSGVIPFTIVWGGRLKDAGQMLRFESVSLLINLLAVVPVAIRSGFIKPVLPASLVTAALWALALLLALNTVGNLFAESWFELLVFTPVTFVCAVLLFRLAMSR